MTQEQMQITMAYENVLKHLASVYEGFMQDAIESPEDFDGIREADAYIWFIESF